MDDRERQDGWTAPSGRAWEVTMRGPSTDTANWREVDGVWVAPAFELATALQGGPVPDDAEDAASPYAARSTADPLVDSRKVRYFFEVRAGALRCVEVRVSLRSGSPAGIRRSDLQAAAPTEAEHAAIRYFHENRRDMYGHTAPEPRGSADSAQTAHSRRRRQRITPELLAEVARVYTENIGNAPAEAVRLHFGISLRAASERVTRAHREGYLERLQRKGGDRG